MTKLEEVARAIHAADGGLNWETLSKPSKDLHRLWARAALEALRAPNEAMRDAGFWVAFHQDNYFTGPHDTVEGGWPAMIDAILKEKP